jgi:sulfofructose kinase
MGNSDFQVLGLGQCCLDYIVRVDSYPPPDAKCEYGEMVIEGGGPVATALVALTRWGIRCTLTGIVGDDPFGPRIRSSLREEGVDTEGLLVRTNSGSQFAFIVAEPGAGRRTVFWRRPTGRPPQPDEVDLERLRRAHVFYTDGLFPQASLAAAGAAREAGIPVVVDAGSLREGMLELAALSTHFLASEKFARELLGEDDPRTACRRLAELGPRVAGVTLGGRGYVAEEKGTSIEGTAYPVSPVDTTGCGDVFHAGYTYGLLQGWETERRLDFGAWAAARTSLRLGGRAGIPPRTDYPPPASSTDEPPDPSGRPGRRD